MRRLEIILALLLIAEPVSAVIITEVQIAGDQADHDYVKIYNSQAEDLDLSGFRLRKKSSTGREYSLRVFPRGTIIAAHDYLLWANSRSGFAESMEAELESTATLANNNSVALFCPEGEILSALAWGQGSDQFQEGDVLLPNPEPHQQIKRKQFDDVYQATGSNMDDFFLTEMPSVEIEAARQKSVPLRRRPQPIFGLILGAVVVSLFAGKVFSLYYQKDTPS